MANAAEQATDSKGLKKKEKVLIDSHERATLSFR